MISGHLFTLRQFARRLWVRAALVSALAFLAPLIALPLATLTPGWVLSKIREDTVRSLLDILANSMLAVTTFSLTVMVTAHLHAASLASPRAHRILSEDARTQIVMATFIGSFVYALIAIVMLQLELVGKEAYPTLYIMTLAVVLLIIVTIMRWIAHLTELGSIEETTRRIEARTEAALRTRVTSPCLGARALDATVRVPEGAHAIASSRSGFIQHIDVARMNEIAEERGGTLYVHLVPGAWAGIGDLLAEFDGEDFSDETEQQIDACFTLADVRSFDQDVEFGVRVMAEIAERALSPGVNDPRTATDVIARLVTIIEKFDGEHIGEAVAAPHVFVPPLNLNRILQMAFDPIARDGRAFVEVQLHHQIAMNRLSRHREPRIAEAARILSGRGLAYAEMGLALGSDLEQVRSVAVVKRAASWVPPESRAAPMDAGRDGNAPRDP